MSANCPGFKGQGHRPTKCRKCFKDISDHKIDLGPVSVYGTYRIRRGTNRSTLELDNLGSAANLTTLRYDSNTNLAAASDSPRVLSRRNSRNEKPPEEPTTSITVPTVNHVSRVDSTDDDYQRPPT